MNISSTAQAVYLASEFAEIVGIGSPIAGEGLEGLDTMTNFNDNKSNATTFVVLQRKGELPPPTGNDITTFVMTIGDTHGSLVDVLDLLAENDVTLNDIKSIRKRDGKVSFLLAADGHEQDEKIAVTLDALAEKGIDIKRLGSCPKDNFVTNVAEGEFDFPKAIKKIKEDVEEDPEIDENTTIVAFRLNGKKEKLRDALKPFKTRGVNLKTIDSQPSGVHGEHIFYIAYDRSTEDQDALIEELATHCTNVIQLDRK